MEKKSQDKQLIAANQSIKEKDFWLGRLAGFPGKVGFPYDRERAGQSDRKYENVSFVFPGEVASQLLKVSNFSDVRLHIILVAGVVLLLNKYNHGSPKDITVVSPIDKQDMEGEFINTVLTLRNQLTDNMTLKDLLLLVSQVILEASENQNFPIETVFFPLDIPFAPGENFPLSDVAVLLENIHNKDDIRSIHTGMTFAFRGEADGIAGTLEYNSFLYDSATVENIITCLTTLFGNAFRNVNLPLSDIDLVSGEEKRRLLYDFNNTTAGYPDEKTVHRWFAEQVERNPDKTAVCAPLDLGDIYDQLASESVNTDPGVKERMEICRFKRNPFIAQSHVELPVKKGHADIYILKNHRHDSVIVNRNMVGLLSLFDGKGNLKFIYSRLKELMSLNGGELQFLVYSVIKSDLLEVSVQLDNKTGMFSAVNFDAFVRLVKTLYRHHLLELAGIGAGEPGSGDSIADYFTFTGDVVLRDNIDFSDLLTINREVTHSRVLLLGDTPGIPTTGLLYLGSYLMRNGIKTSCRFYDPGTSYASMKQNIEALLDAVQPEIVAVSLKWFLYIARVIDTCKIVKEYAERHSLDIKVVVGGNTASYYRREMIEYDWIDYLIAGDGEEPLLKICRGEREENIPNCTYKKDGKTVENPITYVQDAAGASRVYLSHLDDLLLSHHASHFGAFFIYTHKGCAMNCLYCGGCNQAQRKVFNRKSVFRRGIEEVRNDITAAKKFTSTFQFDFDIPDGNLLDYCRRIWEGIDLSGHFCIFAVLRPASPELIRLISRTFKYVYWDLDISTASERHREQLESLKLLKPQPSDHEIFCFMDECEKYDNIEVRLNLITGLPYFKEEDIKPSREMLLKIMSTYSCFGELHWARLHAQPGAPVVENADQYHMHSSASLFEDFLEFSKENFKQGGTYTSPEDFAYPYIYFKDDHLNSRVTGFYLEVNKEAVQHKEGNRKRDLIVCDQLSYRQLNEKAGQVSGLLISMGVRPGGIVGLMLERSLHIPVGILAILKTGCCYLPLDPEYPRERKQYMLKDSNAAALLTTRDLFEEGDGENDWQGKAAFIDGDFDVSPSPPPVLSTAGEAPGPSNLVYTIYTSGTTGKPKGTLLEHGNLVNYVNWFSTAADLTGDDKTILTSSFAFDLGYTSLYSSLLTGCELHILPREIYLLAERLLDYIKQKGITYIKVTPSLFSVIVNSPHFSRKTCRSLRFAAVGGEPINVKDIEKAHSICPHIRVMNHYGPTEATIGCVSTLVDFDGIEEYKKQPVIGKPIFNTNINILGKDLNVMPVGVPGELCISGACVARGYLNRPELTAEKFTPLYRTGDLARWLPDGTIEFLGRIDNQVKVRGYRVELGEIENRLRKHPHVEEAVVVVKEVKAEDNAGDEGDKSLCAYIVPGQAVVAPAAKAAGDKRVLKLKELPQSFITRFKQRVETAGEDIAVKSNGRSLTYASLNRYADGVARKIMEEYDDRYKLTGSERIRYKRQMLLHGWGHASQEKLKSTTVFVAGAGGGASPTIVQLALVGVGTIKVCDFDDVELSNLNRQFLHDHERLGMNKALSAQVTVNKMNPNVNLIPYTRKLTRENAADMVGDADIIFDMFDGPADKFVLSEYATAKGIPHVIISMTDINAYTAILHTPETPCYHCIFDKKKLETIVAGMKNYSDNYSKNPLPVVVTSLFVSTGTAVNEALKILLGFKSPAYNKFFYFNQRGEEEDLIYTPGYKAMTHLFSDHFMRICREQGFDWEVGWRGNYLEELTIVPDPGCPVCGTKAAEKQEIPEMQMKNANEPAISVTIKEEEKQVQTVALLLSRDINMAVGNIGALTAGKTLVPLDPAATVTRLSYILEDSEARVILTDGSHLKLAEKLRDEVNKNIKIIDMDGLDEFDGGDGNLIKTGVDPEQIACTFYSPDYDVLIKEFYDALLNGAPPYIFENSKGEINGTPLSLKLREYLLEELPDYMIPSYFVQLERMPLTANGKLDRRALPDPELSVEGDYTAPGTEVENKLAEIWADVLGIEKDIIGINSNFFDLGGHSLNATIMVAKVHKAFNVRLPLGEVFKTPALKGVAGFIAAEGKDIFTSINPVEKKEYYPLSSAELRLFLVNQVKSNDTSDNTPWAVMLEGQLDVPHLEDTFNRLIRRQELLRTSFAMVEHQPVQRVHEQVTLQIRHLELDTSAHTETGQQIETTIRQFVRPFDLNRPPLLRVGLLKLSEQRHLLVYDMHHIITDGTSLQLFTTEFIRLYAGHQLAPLRIQYKDFATWQHDRVKSGILKKQEEYWLNKFSGEIPTLNLPTDYPRPTVQSFEGDSVLFKLDKDLTAALREIGSQVNATLYMSLLCIYNILLHKYTGQEDIVVGTSSAGRPHSDLHHVVGFFINTLAMRNYPGRDKTFMQLLEEIRDSALDAYENQDYQFDDLVNRLGIQRDTGRQALFDTHFTLQNADVEKKNENLSLPGLTVSNYGLYAEITQFDIIVQAFEENGGVNFLLRYCTKIFKRDTIERFIDYYKEIARMVVENKTIIIEDIKISHKLETAQKNMPSADFVF